MGDLHPFLASFPVAVISLVLLLELAALVASRFSRELRMAAGINIVLGVPLIVLTLISGYDAGENASKMFEVPDQAIADHLFWGRMVLFAVIPLAIVKVTLLYLELTQKPRNTPFSLLYALLLLVTCSIILRAGTLGGELVFKHGAGVSVESGVTPPSVGQSLHEP